MKTPMPALTLDIDWSASLLPKRAQAGRPPMLTVRLSQAHRDVAARKGPFAMARKAAGYGVKVALFSSLVLIQASVLA